jgi:NAD(P)-dependent dehydrogenase (short-subunit alcohol dehydrogenase family)
MEEAMKKWTTKNIPSQQGKVALVTGGTGGIGFESARALARAGAHVIIAADRAIKGAKSVIELQDENPGVPIEFELLDTADLNSVEDFVHRFRQRHKRLDILVNNAGVAGLKDRQLSPQAYERTFATNFLGHFALTGQLLPLLLKSPDPRVVSQSSLAHVDAKIDFDDLDGKRNYDSQKAYGQSKLAMLLFAKELDARARKEGSKLKSIAVHPGGSRTKVFVRGVELSGAVSIKDLLLNIFIGTIGQSAASGALPTLYAATDPGAEGGAYYGPQGLREIRGYPGPAKVAASGRDVGVGARLWTVAEERTGVRFSFRAREAGARPRRVS